MAQAGRELSADEREDYLTYGRLGLTLPDKFANVITENIDVRGPVYRYPTADEQKANDDTAKANADAVKAGSELERKVRAEASKRAQQVVVPQRPDDAAPAVQRA